MCASSSDQAGKREIRVGEQHDDLFAVQINGSALGGVRLIQVSLEAATLVESERGDDGAVRLDLKQRGGAFEVDPQRGPRLFASEILSEPLANVLEPPLSMQQGSGHHVTDSSSLRTNSVDERRRA